MTENAYPTHVLYPSWWGHEEFENPDWTHRQTYINEYHNAFIEQPTHDAYAVRQPSPEVQQLRQSQRVYENPKVPIDNAKAWTFTRPAGKPSIRHAWQPPHKTSCKKRRIQEEFYIMYFKTQIV